MLPPVPLVPSPKLHVSRLWSVSAGRLASEKATALPTQVIDADWISTFGASATSTQMLLALVSLGRPVPSLTVSVARWRPALRQMWRTSTPRAFSPSPKSQRYSAMPPSGSREPAPDSTSGWFTSTMRSAPGSETGAAFTLTRCTSCVLAQPPASAGAVTCSFTE